MAAGLPENVNSANDDESEDERGVCLEDPRDPRVLDCGHYFCWCCLEGILRQNPQGPIKCPKCRAETRLTPGSGIKGLKRPILLQTMQRKIIGYLSNVAHRAISRYCNVDHEEQVGASHFCYDCGTQLCSNCLAKEHADHQTADIEDAAKQSRQRLQEFINTQPTEHKGKVTLKYIESCLKVAQESQNTFEMYLLETKSLLKTQEEKEHVCQFERDAKAKLAAVIKTLGLYESTLKALIESRQSLLTHATYLVNEAPDHELVKKEKDFPTTVWMSIEYIDNTTVKLPDWYLPFYNIPSLLRQATTDMVFREYKLNHAKEVIYCVKPYPTLSQKIWGLTVDMTRRRVVARTADIAGPLKVYSYIGELVETGGPLNMYSYDGQLVESVGAGVAGLADCSDGRRLAIDTKRDMYMAPCDSSLVLVTIAGQNSKAIRVGAEENCGVAYGEEEDLYVVSDCSNHTVYVIDPTTEQVTRRFGSKGSRPTQFTIPYNVLVGRVTGLDGPCIIVSGNWNDGIKLFDTSGNHVKTYGSLGSGDCQLELPEAVCLDHRGRIVVCDRGNKRLLSFWTDSGDQSECLLHHEWGEKGPHLLALYTESTHTKAIVAIDDTLYTHFLPSQLSVS